MTHQTPPTCPAPPELTAGVIDAARALHTLIIKNRPPASGAKPTPLAVEFSARIDELGEAFAAYDASKADQTIEASGER